MRIPLNMMAIPTNNCQVSGSPKTNQPHISANGGVTKVMSDINTAEVVLSSQKYKTNAIAVPNIPR